VKQGAKTVGIRREDKNRWEARAPLTPEQVGRAAREQSLRFLVQSSPIRAFGAAEYEAEGARVVESLEGADLVLAIKEVPIPELQAGKTHAFFSHTFKGQKHNMPMLREILERGITLVDYEKITDRDGRRLVYFGNWAGYAGLVDTLRAYGLRKAAEGISNPFAALRPTYEYGTLGAARAAMAEVGKAIRRDGLPAALAPLVVGITGYGNVSRGVQELLRELPLVEVPPRELAEPIEARRDVVVTSVFHEEHTVERRDGGAFDLQQYLARPEAYRSVFARYLPALSILVNAVYWSAQYPRLVTDDDLVELYGSSRPPRLAVIGDISCDIEGAVQCTKESTEPDDPVYVWDTTSRSVRRGVEGHGPVIMAVDNLPCELPRESSETFGRSFLPFLEPLARADTTAPFGSLELPEALKKAVVVYRGDFAPSYEYMRAYLEGDGETK
jgi:saccharopine dehydrogenase (NAD+, L-lysine forming)